MIRDCAYDLAKDPERRIKFQADVQDYVDMAISSTINLPEWGTEHNNEDTVKPFAELLAKYAGRLRGFTCYPDGSRGGQPLTSVPYEEAIKHKGVVFEENDSCKGGVCGI
jgi:ribonucleoside-diphosphate reductase alpha chain